MPDNDLRLIEDYLPIAEISAEASREKSVRKGHISTLHLWWARRPLVACRAAVYGALVPADRWVPDVTLHNPPDDPAKAEAMKNGAKRGLNRRQARDFVSALCKYPGDPRIIDQARQHVLDAHAQRLSAEIAEARTTGKRPAWMDEFKWDSPEPGRGKGDTVTARDIAEGRAPRPRVLDMFAGGGAIPLEALRLGCEAYALDLNPVAHIIQLCTLVYPQKYGNPDPSARGMTGKPGPDGKPTWGGLAEEVRYWGNWVLEKVRAEIGDLYPVIPDPEHRAPKGSSGRGTSQGSPVSGRGRLFEGDDEDDAGVVQLPPGQLMPVAYLWTRTVRCKNPGCGFSVPLLKQSWLADSKSRKVAARPVVHKNATEAQFVVVESPDAAGLGFDPSALGGGRGTACPQCGTVADLDYIKSEGQSHRFGHQLVAVVCTASDRKGKFYLPASSTEVPPTSLIESRLEAIQSRLGVAIPDEPLEANPRSFDVQNFGFARWRDILTARQTTAMTAFAGVVGAVHDAASGAMIEREHAKALAVCLSMVLGRMADYCTAFCTWQPEFIKNTFNAPGLPMLMDFVEGNPLGGASGSWQSAVSYVCAALQSFASTGVPAVVTRASALDMPHGTDAFDAVVTDPPYYDSRSYSNLSDHFFVWHKRALARLLPEHFAGQLTPKKNEAIAARYRHAGSARDADAAYEAMMQKAFEEAQRVLKPGAPLVCVYAHKTTAGWSTLINSLRESGFMVVEAWPIEMERRSRQNALEAAALASSIFLVARKRESRSGIGNYEDDVQPALEDIVRERVATLWEMGITGADLVIACVGAGLRAFTKYERVEYASGEPVPAEKFLAEVEAVVLDTLMERLLAGTRRAIANGNDEAVPAGVGMIDPVSRFYVLWRYIYKAGDLDAGEAITFANGLHVELDGQGGLTDGRDAVLEKKKSKYRLRDYADRGRIESLGLPGGGGENASLIDVLHRTLYLMEHRPAALREYLDQARPNRERLRLLAASLAGPGLSGKSEEDASRLVATTAAEQSALGKLLANWRTLVPESIFDAGRRG